MISVCIATFNGEKFIREQIDSILCQIADTDEIVISDDSSTDQTLAIIRSYNDARIILLERRSCRSPVFNFENAIKNSRGDVIFLADQDDIWDTHKVVHMLSALDENSMVISDCKIINDYNETLIESFFAKAQSGNGFFKNLYKNTYLGCCMAFKREVLIKALPFPKDIPMHDIWLGFVCELFFKSVFIPEKLTFYRKHDNNTSTALNIRNDYSFYKKLMFRINLIKYLPLLLVR